MAFFLGLLLQIGGLVVAGVALVVELGADVGLGGSSLKQPRRRENPWQAKVKAKVKRTSSLDRAAYRARLQGRPGLYGDPGSDPDSLNATEYIADRIIEREQAAASDWAAQRREYLELHAEITKLFEQQGLMLDEQQAAVRRRVRVEFSGLFFAMLGTLISGFAG